MSCLPHVKVQGNGLLPLFSNVGNDLEALAPQSRALLVSAAMTEKRWPTTASFSVLMWAADGWGVWAPHQKVVGAWGSMS